MSDIEQNARELPNAAITALTNGRKIEAIKILRLEWKIDLKEAKDAVEQYLSSVGSSQGIRSVQTVERGRGRFPLVIFVVIFLVIGYYVWTKS